jgi:hypothetical protein
MPRKVMAAHQFTVLRKIKLESACCAWGPPGGEIGEAMARARRLWNRLMREIGYPGDELLTSLCHEQLTLRGQASRAEAL